MDQSDILKIIESIQDAKSPFLLEGEIEDLSKYTLIYKDTYSNEGFKIYYNSTTKSLIEEDWEDDRTHYKSITLEDFCYLITEAKDQEHFLRAIVALKQILGVE